MSLAHQLDLDDPHTLFAQVQPGWADWITIYPVLERAGAPDRLRGWLTSARPAEADEVLQVLARIASVNGDNDRRAARLMAWALLPGATTLAHRLRLLDPEIDHLVAAQLWEEIRSFPCGRLNRVAANIMMNTRAEVLRTCGSTPFVERRDRTWSRTRPIDPTGPFWALHDVESVRPVDSASELADVLQRACDNGVLSHEDRFLLLCLVEASRQVPVDRVGRGHNGFMANEVSRMVAERCGTSPSTVRRRTRRSLQALAEAYRRPQPSAVSTASTGAELATVVDSLTARASA